MAQAPLGPFTSRARLFTAIAVLMAAHVAVRLFTSPIASIDEGWQLVLGQSWSLGYHGHPPLYTWLQILLFKIFGESLFALAVLKMSLLFGLYALTYETARLLTKRHDYAVFATLSFFVIPQIAWESHRDLTHSVLLSTTTAATVFAFFRIAANPTRTAYLLLGACAGCALLSKYNAGIFLFAAVTAALTIPNYRALFLTPKVVFAILGCMAVAAPHGIWALFHQGDAFAATHELGMRPAQTLSKTLAAVPLKFINAFLPNFAGIVIVYLLARNRPYLQLRSNASRLIFWTIVVSGALFLGWMLAAKATAIRGRWFQPLYVCAPILLIAQLQTIPRWLFKLLWAVSAAAALAVLIGLPIHQSSSGGTKRRDITPETLHTALAGAGKELRSADVLVGQTFWVGGNLRMIYRKPVVVPETAKPLRTTARIAIVFYARKSETPDRQIQQLVDYLYGRPTPLRVVYLTPPGDPNVTGIRLGVAVPG